jgi:hypothetical protein
MATYESMGCGQELSNNASIWTFGALFERVKNSLKRNAAARKRSSPEVWLTEKP